jgi:hypothetical protein
MVYVVLAIGETTLLPLEYEYVFAPLGVIVNESPAQIEPLFTVTIGKEFTVTELTASFDTQPLISVPVIL